MQGLLPSKAPGTNRENVARFLHAVEGSLRVGCIRKTVLRIPFRLDVYRFLFSDKTELYQQDFDEKYFTLGWFQWYRKFDEFTYCGHAIVFPLKVKCFLQWTKSNGFVKDDNGTLLEKPRTFVETIRVKIFKRNLIFRIKFNIYFTRLKTNNFCNAL